MTVSVDPRTLPAGPARLEALLLAGASVFLCCGWSTSEDRSGCRWTWGTLVFVYFRYYGMGAVAPRPLRPPCDACGRVQDGRTTTVLGFEPRPPARGGFGNMRKRKAFAEGLAARLEPYVLTAPVSTARPRRRRAAPAAA